MIGRVETLSENVANTRGEPAMPDEDESLSPAFIAALQQLPPRQRAALLLHDMCGFRAWEVASMLETSPGAVHSAIERARERLADALPGREGARLPRSAAERRVVARFIAAHERGDLEGIAELLSDDALLTMLPEHRYYRGGEAIGALLAMPAGDGRPKRYQGVTTRANGQPAVVWYVRSEDDGVAHVSAVNVLTLRGDQIAAITAFADRRLLARFGLPATLPDVPPR